VVVDKVQRDERQRRAAVVIQLLPEQTKEVLDAVW
jgi:hypothetical protein